MKENIDKKYGILKFMHSHCALFAASVMHKLLQDSFHAGIYPSILLSCIINPCKCINYTQLIDNHDLVHDRCSRSDL